MKKIFIRLFRILTITIMTVTGCGNNTEDTATLQPKNETDTQISDLKNIPNDIQTLKMNNIPEMATDFKTKLGRIFYFLEDRDDLKVGFVNPLTGDVKEITVVHSENYMICTFDVTKDEMIYVLTVPLKGGNSSKVYQLNLNGEIENEFTVEGQPVEMKVDNSSTIYLAYENAMENKPNEIHTLSSEGKVIAKTQINKYPRLLKANDDSVHIISTLNESAKVDKISSDGTISVSPFQNVADVIAFQNVMDGANNYSFYTIGKKGVMGYDVTASDTVLLLGYDDLSTSPEYLETVIPLNDKSFCIVSNNEDDTERHFEIYNVK